MSQLYTAVVFFLVVPLLVFGFLTFYFINKQKRAEKNMEAMLKERFIYDQNPRAMIDVANIEGDIEAAKKSESYCRLVFIVCALLFAAVIALG